jgi:uncharacterized membrane protein
MVSVAATPEFHAKAQRRKGILTEIYSCAPGGIRVLSGRTKQRKPMPDNQNQTPPPTTAGEDKTVAIVAYLTLIGFLVAINIHSNKKTKLGAFHLRQMLGFMLSWLAVVVLIIIPFLGWILLPIVYLFLIVCWIMGLIAAINGQMKPMPVVGPLYQKWFGTTFD